LIVKCYIAIKREQERERESAEEKETDDALGRSRSGSKPEKIKGKTMIKAVITDLGAVFDLRPQCGSGRGRDMEEMAEARA